MVEDRWRFCNDLNLHKYISIRIILRNIHPWVEGGGIKQKKFWEKHPLFCKNI